MYPMVPVSIQRDGNHLNTLLELDALKDRLRISGSSEDTLLTSILNATTTALEAALARPVRQAVYYHYFDAAPCGTSPLYLKFTPIISVDAIEFRNGSTWTAIPPADYHVLRTWNDPQPPTSQTIVEPDDEWDLEVDERRDPFRVKATCGWNPVPDVLMDVGYRWAMDRYTNPTTLAEAPMYRVGHEIRDIVEAYRLRSF